MSGAAGVNGNESDDLIIDAPLALFYTSQSISFYTDRNFVVFGSAGVIQLGAPVPIQTIFTIIDPNCV